MTSPLPGPHVFDATVEGFVSEVVERSAEVPVVVDFWAEWCQPCRVLGPTLEKLAVEYDGQFVLARANTEALGEIAAGFGVRSIPAVFGIKDGAVVASFVGAQSEATLRDWLDRLLPTETETLTAEGRKLLAADPEAAGERFRAALALTPDHVPAKIGSGRAALALGRLDEARLILGALERRGYLEPEAETLKAELTVQGATGPAGDLGSLRENLAAHPTDNPGRLALAERLAAQGQYPEALELALDLVETDRKATGEPARKLMIAVFQLLPPDSEVAHDYRRRLSFALS